MTPTPAAYRPECPILFKRLLELLCLAMGTDDSITPEERETWVDRAQVYLMAIKEMKGEGLIPDFANQKFLNDFREIMLQAYGDVNVNRMKWTQKQQSLTFAVANTRSAFERR